MGFPVAAYRNNGNTKRASASSGGYQKPPRPANDNIPRPANDNWRPFPKPKPPVPRPFGRRLPPGVAAVVRRSLPLGKLLARGVPLLGTALLLYDLYELSRRFPRSIPGAFNLYGWTLVTDCRPGAAYTGQLPTDCSQVVSKKVPGPMGIPIPKNVSSFSFMEPLFTQNTFGWWEFRHARRYKRTVQSLPGLQRYVVPSIRPMPDPVPHRPWVPAVDPFVLPPLTDPLPTPSPLPRGVPSPATWQEGDWSQTGNSPNPRPNRRPSPYHPHRRPPPKEKEKKSKVREGFSIALKGGYAATEMQDAVEALVDGVWTPWGKLPPAFSKEALRSLPAKADVFAKIKWAVQHWADLDPSQAAVNLGANGLIDLVVGVPQGALTDFANQHGFVHGPLAFDGLKLG